MTVVITIVHGGQTGVDRGAHEAAIANGWRIAGCMPRDGRDELGAIPADVAKFLTAHASANYAARTEANVHSAQAVLIVVHDRHKAHSTPGTAKTIDLARRRGVVPMIVDPAYDTFPIARWIWDLIRPSTLMLPLDGVQLDAPATRLMIAGPRESKWPGARETTVALLGRVALAIAEIGGGIETKQDPVREQR